MNDFRYKLMRFFSGRYGIDNLFYLLFCIAAVISVLNIFVRTVYLQIIVYALVVYALFRVMSRNIAARSRENRAIFSWISKAKAKKDTYKQRKSDKTHIYKKCPYCKATLRLPRKKGSHKTICPACKMEFSVRVFKD